MKKPILSLILGVICGTLTLPLWAQSKVAERLTNAGSVLKEIMAASDKGIPHDIMEKSTCVAVVPGLKKGAFGVGGEHGKGVVACRKDDGHWGPPSMLDVTGFSFGFQIGGESIDLIMVIMNRKGIDFLTKDKFQVGADLNATAGPVGRDAGAGTDAMANAEIYTYSRSKGLFGGISLKGAAVTPDKDANKEIYGKPVSANALLKNGSEATPPAAKGFMEELRKYSRR